MSFGKWVSQAHALIGIMHGQRAFGGPLQANLSLTNRCNLRCIHCYAYSPLLEVANLRVVRRARSWGQELPSSEVIWEMQSLDAELSRTNHLIDELLGMGTRRFQLSGNGELFLHKHVLDFVARVKRGGAFCLANTNGTLLDRATIDELIHCGFDELRITVMGGNEVVYQRTHPGVATGVFSRVQQSLEYLAERKASLRKNKPRVKLVDVIVPQNYDGIVDFADFASRVRADGVLLKPFDTHHDPHLAPLVLSSDQEAVTREQLIEAEELLDHAGIRHNCSHFSLAFRRRLDTRAVYRIIPCYYGWLASMIEPDGNIYACCRCSTPLGNVRENGFAEIWNGERYRHFRHVAGCINRHHIPPGDCDCDRCVNYSVNLRLHQLLHPGVRGSTRWQALTLDGGDREE